MARLRPQITPVLTASISTPGVRSPAEFSLNLSVSALIAASGNEAAQAGMPKPARHIAGTRLSTAASVSAAMPSKAMPAQPGAPMASADSPITEGGASRMNHEGASRSGRGSCACRSTTIAVTTGQKNTPTPRQAHAMSGCSRGSAPSGTSTLPTIGMYITGVSPGQGRRPASQRLITQAVTSSCSVRPHHHSGASCVAGRPRPMPRVASSIIEMGRAAAKP